MVLVVALEFLELIVLLGDAPFDSCQSVLCRRIDLRKDARISRVRRGGCTISGKLQESNKVTTLESLRRLQAKLLDIRWDRGAAGEAGICVVDVVERQNERRGRLRVQFLDFLGSEERLKACSSLMELLHLACNNVKLDLVGLLERLCHKSVR